MSFLGEDITLELTAFLMSVAVVLPAYILFASFRWPGLPELRPDEDVPLPTSTFDVSAIAPQIQRLRQDHLAASHSRPQRIRYRSERIGAARRMVTDLAYFHHAEAEHEARNR